MAAAFTKSTDFQSSDKCIEFLLSKGVEIPEGMVAALPAVAFHGYFTAEKIKEWDKKESVAELKKKAEERAEKAWEDWVEDDVDKDWKELGLEIRELLGEGIGGIHTSSKKSAYPNAGQGMKISSKKAAEFVILALTEKKEKIRQEIVGKVIKGKKKAGGTRREKREDNDFEIVYTNEKDEPQGKDYKYYLDNGEEDDVDEVVAKDGKIQEGKDGGKDVKKRTWKAVKREDPFLCKDKCCGAVAWDRAAGSKVLVDLGVKGSFRMGCSADKVSGDFCGKCDGRADNVYQTTYKAGKQKGKTYAQVIVEVQEMSGTAMEGECDETEWARELIGDKWFEAWVDED